MQTVINWTRRLSSGYCPCGSGHFAKKCCYTKTGKWKKASIGRIENLQTGYRNNRCYLSNLGGCSQQISKEHFISRNVLEQIDRKAIRVLGGGSIFQGKDDFSIGLNSLASNILCTKHNSALSPLDSVAGDFFSNVEDIAKKIADVDHHHERLYISSGVDMERWMIKVLCGLVSAGMMKNAAGNKYNMRHVEHVIPALMGDSRLFEPLGLYFEIYGGQEIRSAQTGFSPINIRGKNDEIGGMCLKLSFLTLVLITNNEYEDEKINETFGLITWTLR